MPPELRAFCVYEWLSAAAPDLGALTAIDTSIIRRDRDCAVVAPNGSIAVNQGWPDLLASFHAQTGVSTANSSGTSVRVAVIDSAPLSSTAAGSSVDQAGHGYSVSEIIRDVLCPGDAGCPHVVATHLALPRETLKTTNYVRGGFYGFQSEVAAAVYEAVKAWQAAGSENRLVLNLSLGWERRYGGEIGAAGVAGLPAAVQAAYTALEFASCHGAAIVAAAGNDPGGPTPSSGPEFPAGWETKQQPNGVRCNALLGGAAVLPMPHPVVPPAGSYAPLVHAVAGVRGNDLALLSTRLQGRPRLVAPASHALAIGVDGGPTSVLTGTSVAAAVVSGIVASGWAHKPSETAPELLQRTYSSAVSLNTSAEFCLNGSCPSIKRVNHCQLLQQLCAQGTAAACPTQACVPRPAFAGTTPGLTSAQRAVVASAATEHADAGLVGYELPPLPVCQRSRILSAVPLYRPTTCPDRQYETTASRPWSAPKPGDNPCPVCYITQTSPTGFQLTLAIDPEFPGILLETPVLTINRQTLIPLPQVGPLAPGAILIVHGIETGTPLVHSASIAFKAIYQNAEMSITSELLLSPP